MTIGKKSVTIRWAYHCFHVFVKHHYSCNSFYEEKIFKLYLLHFSSMYAIKYLGEIYGLQYCFEIFFNDSVNSQNLRGYVSILLKAILIFCEYFFDFLLDTVEK